MNLEKLNLSTDSCYVLAQTIDAVDCWHQKAVAPRHSNDRTLASLRGLAAEMVSIFGSAGSDDWDAESVCLELTSVNGEEGSDEEITFETLLSIPRDELGVDLEETNPERPNGQ